MNIWKKALLGTFVAIIMVVGTLHVHASETTKLVRSYLQKIALGSADSVRRVLPELLVQYPDDPGIMFLHAALVEDAVKALPLFHKIVANYSTSEWADDAQWRIVQVYALANDSARARRELQNFKEKYATSEYLLYAVETVRATVGLSGGSMKNMTVQTERKTVATPEKSTGGNQQSSPAATPIQIERKRTSTRDILTPDATQKTATATDKNSTEKSLSEKKSQGLFTLQVGVFSSREAATNELAKYSRLRLRCDILEKNTSNGVQYAVTVGEYDSREAAENARPRIGRICNCQPFAVVK